MVPHPSHWIEGVGSESDRTRRMITAMETVGVHRLVVVSTHRVTDPADRSDLKRETLVRLSRPPPQTRTSRSGQRRMAYGQATSTGRSPGSPGSPMILRPETSRSATGQTADDRHLHQAPAIST
jgi:hypothetical protein